MGWSGPHYTFSRGWRKGSSFKSEKPAPTFPGNGYVLDIVLYNLHVLLYITLTATLLGECHYYLHFIGEKFGLLLLVQNHS